MPNYKLLLEYDGAHFAGWQKQPGKCTVEQSLLDALSVILRSKEIKLTVSGRTDAGVHARGQVANFHFPSEINLYTLSLGLSSLLRNHVAVLSAEKVSDDFHARRSACGKIYEYQILNRSAAPVLNLGHVWHVPQKLDVQVMQQQSLALIGMHDFSSFRAADCPARNPIKTITAITIQQFDDLVVLQVEGSGFLKQMVRNIVGTLVEYGLGTPRFHDRSIAEILATADRTQAGRTAPACGLSLKKVLYCSTD